MTWMTLKAVDQKDLISDAIASVSLPEGVEIRIVDFESDLPIITKLPMGEADTMHPAYGMAPADTKEEITLIATKNGVPAAQISAELQMLKQGSGIVVEVYVNGVFVSQSERGRRIGTSLGKAVVEIAEDWRQAQAVHMRSGYQGEVIVSGYAHPDTAGESTLNMMSDYASNIHIDQS